MSWDVKPLLIFSRASRLWVMWGQAFLWSAVSELPFSLKIGLYLKGRDRRGSSRLPSLQTLWGAHLPCKIPLMMLSLWKLPAPVSMLIPISCTQKVKSHGSVNLPRCFWSVLYGHEWLTNPGAVYNYDHSFIYWVLLSNKNRIYYKNSHL